MNIYLTSDIQNHWLWKDPQRFQWWLDLQLQAATEEKTIVYRGQNYICQKGQVFATLSTLAERWKTTRSIVRRFLEKLAQKNMIRHNPGTDMAQITICNSEDNNPSWHSCGTDMAQQKADGTDMAQITICNSEDNNPSWHSCGTDNDTSKKEKETKEKKEPKKRINNKNKNLLTARTHAREGEEKNKQVTPKSPTLVSKARKVFEDVYLALYGSSYYWAAKDASNMAQLLKKISFSRTNRPQPLSVDDDSMLVALQQFLTAINKEWISNNFSVPKINSYYNDIISEIKNQKIKSNGQKSTNSQTQYGADNSASTRQKQVVFADLSTAEEKWQNGERFGVTDTE